MRIERVLIQGLRVLNSRDDRLLGLDGEILPALCLRGPTGSGKTTYLEVLAQLWQWFRRCAAAKGFAKPTGTPLLGEAALCAVLLSGLPGPRPRMWLAYGKPEQLRQRLGDQTDLPLKFKDDSVTFDQDLLSYWRGTFESAEKGILGGAPAPPNIVWIEAENKHIRPLHTDELTGNSVTAAYYAVARYLPEARGASHLEGLIRTLALTALTQPEPWDDLAQAIEDVRPGLRLLKEFQERTERPLLQRTDGARLTVDRLSAGERSLLINLCMVLRWLTPGGIVLLDEPELHQHLSLMRGSLALLRWLVCERRKGQLLVASHAPEVWDAFRPTGAITDLGDEDVA